MNNDPIFKCLIIIFLSYSQTLDDLHNWYSDGEAKTAEVEAEDDGKDSDRKDKFSMETKS